MKWGRASDRADLLGARAAARDVLPALAAAEAARRTATTEAGAVVRREGEVVLATMHEARFVDLAPTEIYAQLLDEGQHLCSIRTMYRVLAENEQVWA